MAGPFANLQGTVLDGGSPAHALIALDLLQVGVFLEIDQSQVQLIGDGQ
jgi:hypothetical protein